MNIDHGARQTQRMKEENKEKGTSKAERGEVAPETRCSRAGPWQSLERALVSVSSAALPGPVTQWPRGHFSCPPLMQTLALPVGLVGSLFTSADLGLPTCEGEAASTCSRGSGRTDGRLS